MITCLHTADVHVATFGALLPGSDHVVRADFLDRARTEGLVSVASEAIEILRELSNYGPVLCTCSTLGPLVDELGLPNVGRIDRPAMEAAVVARDEVVVAICLESTQEATLALFEQVSAGRASAKLVLCDAAWALFEAGDAKGYAAAIADTLEGQGDLVLLAQASMAVAAPLLEKVGVRVFTTPAAAAEAVAALDV